MAGGGGSPTPRARVGAAVGADDALSGGIHR